MNYYLMSWIALNAAIVGFFIYKRLTAAKTTSGIVHINNHHD